MITCVDTVAARRTIGKNMLNAGKTYAPYWLDCGNSRRSGQFFLTQAPDAGRGKVAPVTGSHVLDSLVAGDHISVPLPALWDVLPEMFDQTVPEDDTPSCSLAESLRAQDLFVNDHVSR